MAYNTLVKTFIKTSYIIHAGSKMPTQRFSAVVILMVAVVAAAAFTSILLFGGDTIYNQGGIEAVELCVYWERSCINEVPAINWGDIEPGSSNTVTIFVRNEGTVPVSVNLATDDWNPTPVASYVTFDTDLESHPLSPQSVLKVDLTLAVSPDVAGISNFSFDIVITGSDS